jgi:hypothetical protein
VRVGGGDLTVVAGASNTGYSDVVSVDLESEVLEGIAVANGLSRVGFSKLKNTGVFVCAAVVLHDTLTNLGDVEKAVEEVRGPVKVSSAVGDVVAEHAHALEGTTDLIGEVADYGLRGGVGSSPVASPA